MQTCVDYLHTQSSCQNSLNLVVPIQLISPTKDDDTASISIWFPDMDLIDSK